MFAVIPIQFAFAVHYFVVWPIAATLSCCLPIFFSNLHAVHTHHKCLQHVTFWVFFNIFTSCGTLQPICLPLRVTLLYRRRVCGVSLSIPAFRLHCPLSIALHCIVLHCIVHLSSSPICSPPLIGRGGLRRNFSFTRVWKFALGGDHQGDVLVQVRISLVICSLTSVWSSLHSYALSFIARQATF